MKIRISTIVFAMCAFFVVGCTGTPVAVNRFGNVQPAVQVYQTLRNYSTVTEIKARSFDMPSKEDRTNIFGVNGMRTNQIAAAFGSQNQDSSTTLFDFNGCWPKEEPLIFTVPYNQERVLTTLQCAA